MKTTTLKHKNYSVYDERIRQTDAEREAEKAEIAESIRNDPCLGLWDALDAIDDGYEDGMKYAPPPEYVEAENAYWDCRLQQGIRKLQDKNPRAIIVGATDYVLFCWPDSLITPPTDDYIPIGEGSPEIMDARRFSLMLALPGYEDRDHIRLTIETRVVERIDENGESSFIERHDKTSFTVHVGGRIIARGEILDVADEKERAYVVMRGDGATKELAELVLSQCTGIDPWTEWPLGLYARFALIGRCHQCGRRLTDHVSKVLQVGPTCAKGIGLEHSQRMAQRVTELRKAQA